MKLSPLILAAAVLAGCTAAPQRPADVARGDHAAVKDYVTRLIRHEMDQESIPGLSIALVDDQRVVWAEGFGYADREREIPATAQTLYRVGSISKLFTDIAALQLAEKAQLDIDRPLRDYLPDFAIRTHQTGWAPITPRQLMTHHAGLPRDLNKGFMTSDPAPFAGVLENIRTEYAYYPPDTLFAYSNLGITLLGTAIQKISGMPFADYMRQSVLDPLGMASSSFDTGLATSPLMAKGYRGRDAASEPPLRDVPAGGLNSSVSDLSRFMSMVFAGGQAADRRIVKTETIDEMLRPQNKGVELDLDFRVGLGWMLTTLGNHRFDNAGTAAHHNGATAYFRAQMYLLPEHKLGVVVLANSSTAGQAVDRIASEALSLALEAKAGIRGPERSRIPPAEELPSAVSQQDYIGNYTTIAGLVRIRPDGNGLRASVAGHDFDLVWRRDGRFGLDYSLLGFIPVDLGVLGDLGFSRRRIGQRDLLVAYDGVQEMVVGQRIAPKPDPGVWRRRLGEYEIVNPGNDHRLIERIRVGEEDGLLIATLTMSEPRGQTLELPFLPLSDSEGLLAGVLQDGGDTVRCIDVDGEEHLAISGYLLRRAR